MNTSYRYPATMYERISTQVHVFQGKISTIFAEKVRVSYLISFMRCNYSMDFQYVLFIHCSWMIDMIRLLGHCIATWYVMSPYLVNLTELGTSYSGLKVVLMKQGF